jgi:S1-C subfamily serine protease
MTFYDIEKRKRAQRSFDDRGRIVRATLFLYQNQAMIDNLGPTVACLTRTTDDKGRLREEACHDAGGRLVRNKQGYARCTIAYDARGNSARSYFDVDGKALATRVVVRQVLPGGQAERLKLQAGDVLQSYDGRPLKQVADFLRWRQAEAQTDHSRPLVLLRQGEAMTVQVAPGPLGVSLADAFVSPAK